MKSIGVYSGDQLSKEFITRQPGVDEWDAMLGFQRENMARLSKEIQKGEKTSLNRIANPIYATFRNRQINLTKDSLRRSKPFLLFCQIVLDRTFNKAEIQNKHRLGVLRPCPPF